PTVRRAAKQLRDPAALRRLRGGRAAVAMVIALLVVGGLLATPWRYTVDGAATATLRDSRPVVATIAGELAEVLPAGAEVQAGDLVARLRNPAARRELARTTAALEDARLRVSHLELLRAESKDANDQLPEARAMVSDLRDQLTELEQHAARLELRAERSGVVVRSQSEADLAASDALTLARWSGALTDPENLGAWVESGQVLAEIADPLATEALLVLPEEDIERIAIGQSVHIAWAQSPGVVTHGEVIEIAARSHHAEMRDESQREREGYLIRVRLADAPSYLRPSSAGKARIDTGSTSLARLGLARVRQLFRLP
ncbi:MAG: HlyD family efflux transporter periplasmic adaptor subunit, partial [Planctomycetales bacterium]|nr:HlyD family efflux transporter periplasmic adaptor subunit [Planctomycetales bacterium]